MPGLSTGAAPFSSSRLRPEITLFKSAPRPSTGATHAEAKRRPRGTSFIRAPAFRPGRHGQGGHPGGAGGVQSAAPAFRLGRPQKNVWRRPPPAVFNPRPGLSTGATHRLKAQLAAARFPIAPRPFDRGDSATDTGDGYGYGVSIRAPGLSTATQRRRHRHVSICWPSTRGGRLIHGHSGRSFNPRPGLSTGAAL